MWPYGVIELGQHWFPSGNGLVPDAVCNFSHRPRTGSGWKLGRARQTVQPGGPMVYGDFMCFTLWQHYRSISIYCRSMVNHLNPRPVVYDFCRHYFRTLLTALTLYLHQCWLFINEAYWTKSSFTETGRLQNMGHFVLATMCYIDGLMLERCNSIADALELHLSCTNSLIWS